MAHRTTLPEAVVPQCVGAHKPTRRLTIERSECICITHAYCFRAPQPGLRRGRRRPPARRHAAAAPSTLPSDPAKAVFSTSAPLVVVPRLVGRRQDDAHRIVERAGLKLRWTGLHGQARQRPLQRLVREGPQPVARRRRAPAARRQHLRHRGGLPHADRGAVHDVQRPAGADRARRVASDERTANLLGALALTLADRAGAAVHAGAGVSGSDAAALVTLRNYAEGEPLDSAAPRAGALAARRRAPGRPPAGARARRAPSRRPRRARRRSAADARRPARGRRRARRARRRHRRGPRDARRRPAPRARPRCSSACSAPRRPTPPPASSSAGCATPTCAGTPTAAR